MEVCLRVHNQLMDFSRPRVMAIINFSPDSFFTSCDVDCEHHLLATVEGVIQSGADILDLGACSTRPLSSPVDAATEWKLLKKGINIIRHHWADIPLSVDTFRADIAEQALQCGADIINDVSGADNPKMLEVLSQHDVPYVLTHSQEAHNTLPDLLQFMQQRLDLLHRLGIKDTIIDPGFGFAKTVEDNYTILCQLDVLRTLHMPILVGVSRKSMLYKPLGLTPQDVLAATVAANTIALERGANILRVHDVEAAKQAIAVFQLTHKDTI